MNLSHTFKLTAAIAACTAISAQSAFAGGEPRNTLPFTRATTDQRMPTAVLSASSIATAWAMISGEAKNEAPFTRPVVDALTRYLAHRTSGRSASAGLGEAKNEVPFTIRVS